jgi:hypothetical protein
MGNARKFRPGRQAARLSQRNTIKAMDLELARQRGINLALQAQLSASKMERPADLEEWIESVALPDMSPEERAQWDSMTDEERETFKDELGLKINTAQKLAAIGLTEADVDGSASQPASAQDS